MIFSNPNARVTGRPPFPEQLDHAEVARLLQQTMKEEATADSKLTECAMSLYDTQGAIQH